MARSDGPGLRTLAAEVDAERAEVALVIGEIGAAVLEMEVGTPKAREWYGLAAMVESAYTGVERALGRVHAAFGGLPTGSDWHVRVLSLAGIPVPGERGPILSPTSVEALRDLLAFRHRVRNLYGHRLDTARVLAIARSALATWAIVDAELASFTEALRAAAARLDDSRDR